MTRVAAPRSLALWLGFASCVPAGGPSGVLDLDDTPGGGGKEEETPIGEQGQAVVPFAPGRPVVRRLLRGEYVATVEALLGPAAAARATAPEDTSLNGLDAIGSSELSISDASVRAYEASARAVVDGEGTAALARFGACSPGAVDDAACLSPFVARFGRLVFRRALLPSERTAFVRLGQEAARAYQDFARGVEMVMAMMLQSPSFLYRVELGQPDPEHRGWRKLTPEELASRMAFFLTGLGPDEALLDAAESGRLATDEQLLAQAARLLRNKSAPGALATFYDETLGLRDLPALAKNQDAFPNFDDALKRSMREETQLLIADVVWKRDADFRDIFDATYTFVDDRLARHYGLAETGRPGFRRVDLPTASKRGGILGHASFLSLQSHVINTSPTLRGKFVREAFLCQPIPAPPPGVNTTLPADQPGDPPKTMRERLAVHVADPTCSGCHNAMDGIGLGLENFDPIGAFRETDNGALIDPVSKFDGSTFQGARELGKVLSQHERTMPCTVRSLYRRAVGRVEERSEGAALRALDGEFERSGYRLKALLAQIVASEGFRYVSEEQARP